MFIALPFASERLNLPSPNSSVVKFAILPPSIASLISVPFAIPAPYCALPLGLVDTLIVTLPAPVSMLALKGMYPPNIP